MLSTIKVLLSTLIAIFTMFTQIISPIFGIVKEEKCFENWSKEQVYTHDYAVTIDKDPNEDFKVLNLADIQLKSGEYTEETGFIGQNAEKMIERLIQEQKPDLITLSGDNAWDFMTYVRLIDIIDSFDIPWAPIMGNHEGQGTPNEFWCAYMYTTAENCVYKFGPKDMGYGNYIINIRENGKVIHTLFMMDTHNNGTFTDENGNDVGGYDHLWENQIEWYEWAIKGIAQLEGKTVESTVIMHIPVYEFKEIYDNSYDKATEAFTGEYAEGSYGVIREEPSVCPVNNGFTDKAIELASTKNMIFGHDHVNNASVLYNGIRLTYGMKTGEGAYYDPELLGGTILTVASASGEGSISHINYAE